MQVKSYSLPDIDILKDPAWQDYRFFTWHPDDLYLVLGQSNDAEKSLYSQLVDEDGIKVFKRPSGGEAVILTPNTLVISTTVSYTNLINPQAYFREINNLICHKLESAGIRNVEYKGISDLAIGNKKILGSSIYRPTGKIFYQAVLNISEHADVIARYIRHPAKEPDYRKGRDHTDFVTSLHHEGYLVNHSQIAGVFEDKRTIPVLSKPGLW
jgi:lipoate-protein ligase A